MKKGTIWIAITCLIVTSLVLASCNKTTTTTTSTSVPTSTATTTKTTTTTTTAPPTSTTTTTAVTGNWWDKLGTPTYGGEMVIRIDKDIISFDPYYGTQMTLNSANMERLHADDWTVDPAVFNYTIIWRLSDYVKGQLAGSWEFTDPTTYVLHIRKGVMWQNIAPANGREFTSDDVLFHYDRMYGLGGGFTKGSPFYSATQYADLVSLTAPDRYTVIFKWKTPNPEVITETLQAASGEQLIECPDAVKQWGDMNTWQHSIGTGPFIFKDFVPGSSATLVKNPNYWGYDERYPQNKLPYIDTLKVLIIPNTATTMAAMRTGKIDVMDGIALQSAQDMQRTNPEILQFSTQGNTCATIDPRVDVKPFNDINV